MAHMTAKKPASQRDRLDLDNPPASPGIGHNSGHLSDADRRPEDIPDPEKLAPAAIPVLVLESDITERYRACLEQLGVNLRNVQARLEGEKRHTDQLRRFTNFGALTFIRDFIEEVFVDGQALCAPLRDVMTALDNIENGHHVGWLSNPVGGRPKGMAVDVGTLRGRCAALAELLFRQRKRLPEACKEVYRAIPHNSSVFAGTSNPGWRTIKRWRDDCMGGLDANSAERVSFNATLALVRNRPDAAGEIQRILKSEIGRCFSDLRGGTLFPRWEFSIRMASKCMSK
jgi:hypothetical protein